MKNFDTIQQPIYDLVQENKIAEAALLLLEAFGLKHPNLAGIEFREKADKTNVVFTTEGEMGKNSPQIIRVPINVFDFQLPFILHMLVHEIVHIDQRSVRLIEDKNIREIEAYSEGVFHDFYPDLPPCPVWLEKQLAQNVGRYYNQLNDTQKTLLASKFELIKLRIEELA
jgi:hypothetical protein